MFCGGVTISKSAHANTVQKVKLWGHQLEAIARARELDGFGLFFEMGTGKTLTTIKILEDKYRKGVLSTLIVAPIITLENWKREILKFSDIPKEKILILDGPLTKRISKFHLHEHKHGKNFIVITAPTSLVNTSGLFELFMDWRPLCLVADESQFYKAHNSKRSKKMADLAAVTTYNYILSGTPILNTPMDIFQQFLILDKGRSFGRNFFAFRARYFFDANARMNKQNYFPKWVIREGATTEINNIIHSKAMYVEKKDCLDLPPLVKESLPVEMTPEQKTVYKMMKDDYVAFLQSGEITADLAITKALRLMQIVTGIYKTSDGKERVLLDTPRTAALSEILEQVTPRAKVIVWCVFKGNYAQVRHVCEKLGVKFVEAHGEVSNEGKNKAVDAFNTDESVRVFIGHPGSLGIGINLIAASYSIYFSRNFSLENDLQSEARNYRGGSEIHASITRYDLYSPGTIDEYIMKKLADKVAVSTDVLRAAEI